jgi:hypothetical protein
VHPLEQLRYLSWASGPEEALPVQEVAAALADLAAVSPGSLLQACRRLVERFPAQGVAWWLCARALSAPDAVEGIWGAAEELAEDPTPLRLAEAIAAEGSLCRRPVALAVVAAGPAEVLLGPEAAQQVASAQVTERQLWAVVPRGRLLPEGLWEALVARAGPSVPSSPGSLGAFRGTGRTGGKIWEIWSAGAFSKGVGDAGAAPLREILGKPTCPPVAELLGWQC